MEVQSKSRTRWHNIVIKVWLKTRGHGQIVKILMRTKYKIDSFSSLKESDVIEMTYLPLQNHSHLLRNELEEYSAL